VQLETKTEEVRVQLAKRLETLPDPQPAFDLQIGWANDYDALFENRFIERGKQRASWIKQLSPVEYSLAVAAAGQRPSCSHELQELLSTSFFPFS